MKCSILMGIFGKREHIKAAKKEGKWKYYHETGELEVVENYKDGVMKMEKVHKAKRIDTKLKEALELKENSTYYIMI